MKKTIFRLICLLLVFLTLLTFTIPVSALEFEGLPSVDGAKSVYFYNISAKRLIIKKGGGTRISPASSVKIMTGLLACEILSDKLDETVTITKDMIRATEGTRMKLAEGDKLSTRSLLYGAICGGFNDAAYALASACSGDSATFVKQMNERAAELGATSTRFVNPTGYDAAGQYTTLEDVALISKAAMNNKLYMEVSSTISKNVEFASGKAPFTVHNRNGLIGSYYAEGYKNKHAEGIIAGVTDLGGHCVITTALIDGSRYLCIVMGGVDSNGSITSYTIANDLISYAASKLSERCVMKQGELICKIPVDYALDGAAESEDGDYLNVRTSRDAFALLPTSVNTADLEYKYHLYRERLSAPIASGAIVGVLDFYYKGEYLTSVPLSVNSSVSANEFLVKMNSMKSAILNRATFISIFCFAIILTIHYFYTRGRRRKTVKEIRLKRYTPQERHFDRGSSR